MNLAIDAREQFRAGSTTQWIRIRSLNPSNPVLLLVQMGPALPMLNEVHRFEHLFGLEQSFTVVYWDQRGCGRSLRSRTPGADITLGQMAMDTVSLLEMLRDRFGTRPAVVGFSMGGTIAALAAAARPDLVSTLVTVGMDIDGAESASVAYDFAYGAALQRGNRTAIRQLRAIGAPPHLTSRQLATRVRWITNFGGVARNESYGSLIRSLLASMMRSGDYSTFDILRTMRGIVSTTGALAPELADVDLVQSVPRIDVPVVMVQGRHDKVSPRGPAERYAQALCAPAKRLVWFNDSTHTPHFDEPAKFRALLLQIRDDMHSRRT
jgi:pimeloyl-ACP methyl ester carboxylesterase